MPDTPELPAEDEGLPIFAEELPPQCPPADAHPPQMATVMRLVLEAPPTVDCFKSHTALGIPVFGDITPCQAASCSVFLIRDDDLSVAMRKLPKVKKRKFVAIMEMDPACGLVRVNDKSGHVDLWMYASFNPHQAVVEVRPRP